jgi:hypothetical protein
MPVVRNYARPVRLMLVGLVLTTCLGGLGCGLDCGGRVITDVELSAPPGPHAVGTVATLEVLVWTDLNSPFADRLPAGSGEPIEIRVFPEGHAQVVEPAISTDRNGRATVSLRLLREGAVTVWAGANEAWSEPLTGTISGPP